jgi:uridine phosphorylase
MKLSPTDLILNADGTVYHLGLLPQHIASTIIVVGDPDRVAQVSKYFDSVIFTQTKREFVTHTGLLAGKKITVISSGMGTDNVEILMNELDALANINLSTRQANKIHKTLNIIRLGTSGAVQASLPVNSLLLSRAAFGMDFLSSFYSYTTNGRSKVFQESLAAHLALPAVPYFVECSEKLLSVFESQMPEHAQIGTTLTCPGFYAPQGRLGRYTNLKPRFLEQIISYQYQTQSISNLEMETAGYYLFGSVFGHHCLSISAILANRTVNQFSQTADLQIDNLIKWALAVINTKLLKVKKI